MPDLNELAEQGIDDTMWYCFPHFFVLPMYSSATSYRFRPLGPEETLMDMWSLTRYPPGEEPETPPVPEPWEHDDPRWPPIPTQDFSNLPQATAGPARARASSTCACRSGTRATSRTTSASSTASWPGCPSERLLPALRQVNLNPLEQPVVEIEF